MTVNENVFMKRIELDLLKLKGGKFEKTPRMDFYIKHARGYVDSLLEQRDKDDYIQDPETGRMQGRTPSGTDGNDLTDGSESGIVEITIETVTKQNITIDERKFTEYALNPEKQPEKAKAFEKALGYNLSNYKELDKKIRDNFDKDKLIKTEKTEFGTKYKQTMHITGPNQKTAKVLTAWIDSTSDSDNKDFHLTSVYVDK